MAIKDVIIALDRRTNPYIVVFKTPFLAIIQIANLDNACQCTSKQEQITLPTQYVIEITKSRMTRENEKFYQYFMIDKVHSAYPLIVFYIRPEVFD